MLFDRLRTISKSLRFRLAAWNALAVIVTGVVTLMAVRIGVEIVLLHETDQVLLDDLVELELIARETKFDPPFFPDQLNRKAEGHIHHLWFAQVIDESGRERWSTERRPDVFFNRSLGTWSIPSTADGFRIVNRQIESIAGRNYTIQVGSSLEFIRADLARIDRIAFFSSAAILVIAPLGGYWLSGQATRPVAEIIRIADRMHPEKLDERLTNRGIGDELDHLADTINRLLDRIGKHLEYNRAFVANAAHELRSPLAAIHSAAEVSLSQPRSQKEYEEFISDVIDETESLTTLVNQLLLIAETETDQLRSSKEVTPLHVIVSRTVDMFRAVAESKGVELKLSHCDKVEVRMDARHARQVLNNLVDNAVKFTTEGGAVCVSLESDPLDQVVLLAVKDNGIGISPEDLPHVFDRFFRGDKARRRDVGPSGNGLGLSICQAIVRATGGSISVESQPGRGSRFTWRMPIEPKDESPEMESHPYGVASGAGST